MSRAQMLELGCGRGTVGEWVARGRLHRLHRGVYAVGHLNLTRNSHFMAAVLACREQRLVVETDGGAAHGTTRAMKRDPVRDADLMIAGWRVWRLSYEQLLRQPDTVAEQLIALGITPSRRPAARVARRRS